MILHNYSDAYNYNFMNEWKQLNEHLVKNYLHNIILDISKYVVNQALEVITLDTCDLFPFKHLSSI